MTKQTAKQVPVKIEIISPLHIGDGQRLNPFVDIVQDKNLVYVLDHSLLMKKAEESDLFYKTLMSAYTESREDTKHVKMKNLLNFFKIRFKDATLPSGSGRYIISSCPLSAKDGVNCFIKTVDNRVYIPGSSLKGSIRSLLLQNEVFQEVNDYQKIMERALKSPKPPDRKHADNQIEAVFFGKDHHHDFLRILQIADSQPKEAQALRIREIQILSCTNNGLMPKKWVINAETIEPGQSFETTITFNHHLLSNRLAANELKFSETRVAQVTKFIEHCRETSNRFIQKEISFYGKYKQKPLVDRYEKLARQPLEDNQCLVHVGWGTGFDSKTVTNFFDDKMVETIRRRYGLGKFIYKHRGCGGLVRKDKPCTKCNRSNLQRNDIEKIMINPLPKTRKVCIESNRPAKPLGWVKLTLG